MKKITSLLFLLVLAGLISKAQQSDSDKSINISKLIVYEKDSRLFIDWATDGTNETNYWEVQSSTDGKKFSTIALVLGADPGKAGDNYEYKAKINNEKPAEFYRIVHISPSGKQQPSKIIKWIRLESMALINPGIKSKIPVLL